LSQRVLKAVPWESSCTAAPIPTKPVNIEWTYAAMTIGIHIWLRKKYSAVPVVAR